MSIARSTLAVLALMSAAASPAWAQGTFGGSTSASPFGDRTTGGASTLQGTSAGAGAFGAGISSSGFSNNQSLSDLTLGSGNAVAAGSFIGSDTQDMTFVGGGRQPANNAARGGIQGGFGQGGFGQGGGFGQNAARAQGQQRGGAGRGFGGGATRTLVLRTKLSVGFGYQSIAVPEVTSRLQTQLVKISDPTEIGQSQVRGLGSVTVAVAGRTAVLSGIVATAEDRDLAVRLAELEPGISEVRSQLTIATADEPATTAN